jgi:hypothetical protein
MKRSCSEWELLVLILSMVTSADEGETLEHRLNCMDRSGGWSMKIALRVRAQIEHIACVISELFDARSLCNCRSPHERRGRSCTWPSTPTASRQRHAQAANTLKTGWMPLQRSSRTRRDPGQSGIMSIPLPSKRPHAFRSESSPSSALTRSHPGQVRAGIGSGRSTSRLSCRSVIGIALLLPWISPAQSNGRAYFSVRFKTREVTTA